ncbi:MAG: hypothetical protein IJL67_08180 [Oscillospiraceae bacterium]|nr:hypothetical protein [Oscillospiraceae bacterium]
MKKQNSKNTTPVRNSQFSKHLRMKLKQNRKIFAVTLLLQLLGIPAAAVCQIIVNCKVEALICNLMHLDARSTTDALAGYEYLYNISLLMLAAAVLSGIFTAIRSFSYLHKRSGTDITLSLPLSKKQLFFADYLSGLLTYIIPYIAVVILTMPVWFLRSEHPTAPFNNPMPVDLIHFSAGDYILPSLGFILKLELFILLTMIFIYTFTVLITICCGTFTDTLIYLVLSNASAGLLLYSFSALTTQCLVNEDIYYNSTYEFERLTPAGAIHFVYRYMCNENEYYHVESGDTNWALWCTALCIICFIAAYLIFLHRKAEDTGKTVIVPALFIITAVLSVVGLIFTVFRFYELSRSISSTETAILILIAVIISFAAYSILLSLKKRKIRFIPSPKEMLLPVFSAASAIALYLAMLNTHAFGMIYSVPDAKDVAKVHIHLPTSNIRSYNRGGLENTYKDTESIKQICDLNTSLNEDLRLSLEDGYVLENFFKENYPNVSAFRSDADDYEHRTIYSDDGTIQITYCMKNGKIYTKTFIPFVTDYTESEIFKYEAEQLNQYIVHPYQVAVNYLDTKQFRVCFGGTEFTERLYGKRFHSYIACTDQYPFEYVATEFDLDLLKNILCTSYYPVYYSTEDCYVFYIEEYNEKTGYYNQTNLKYFLPKEYSDIYEEFIKTSNAHKVKWYTMDENGNKTSVNT